MTLVKRIAVVMLVCMVAALYVVSAHAAAKSTYLIGVVLDVTGPASPLGTPEKQTIEMIQAGLNKGGGINGHPVKFIIYDSASEESKAVLAVKRLIEADKVKVILGPSTTGTTLAIAGICQKAKIPLISCAAGIKITEPVQSYVFKTAQPDTLAVAKILDYLKTKKITKIAFINDSNAFGMSGLEQMTKQAAAAKVTIVAKEAFGSKDTDMTVQLTRIKAANPQAVVCWGTNPGPAIVAKNMKQLGLKMPLIMSHGIANRKFIELAGDAANGVVFPAGRLIVVNSKPNSDPRSLIKVSSIANNDPQKKTLVGYAAQFKSFVKADADTFGGHAWDAAKIVLKAMGKVGDDPSKIRAEIEKTKGFVGISGVFNFSPKDHNGLTKNAFVMVIIQNGQWAMLK